MITRQHPVAPPKKQPTDLCFPSDRAIALHRINKSQPVRPLSLLTFKVNPIRRECMAQDKQLDATKKKEGENSIRTKICGRETTKWDQLLSVGKTVPADQEVR